MANLEFWLSFLEKAKNLKIKNCQDTFLFIYLSIITNDPYETMLVMLKPFVVLSGTWITDRFEESTWPIRKFPHIKYKSLKLKAAPRKLAFVPGRHEPGMRERRTLSARSRSKKEKQNAILWYIHGGTGGLATWRWVSDGAHNGQGRVGTISFIEPTRPEYKILAVHFRDEITHPPPSSTSWRACLAIGRA